MERIEAWRAEEEAAHIHGWDFSHIRGRYEEEALPWNYQAIIRQYLRPGMKLLDIDTGGGEFLLSLGHPFEDTAAMENFPPNVALCQEVLTPLGIDFRPGSGNGPLPFEDSRFDMVIDRHGDFNAPEIHRILKPGGYFITQQVGALVWFARIICWEFPGFSVGTHRDSLLNAQQILDEKGSIEGRTHRFLLVAQKTGEE